MGKKKKGPPPSLVPPLSAELVKAIELIGSGEPTDLVEAKAAAVRAIGDHAGVCDVNRMDLAKAIPPLISLISKGSVTLKEDCVHTLRLLVTNNPLVTAFDNGAAVIAAGGLSPLVTLLRSGSGRGEAKGGGASSSSSSLLLDATATLRLIARSSANRTAIAKEDAIKPLLGLVQQADAEEELRAEATFALGSLAFDHAENRAAITKEGGAKVLAALARDGTPRLQQTAAYALTSLQPRPATVDGELPAPYSHEYEDRAAMLSKVAGRVVHQA